MNIDFPVIFEDLFRPYRYKVFYGGRGGGKSWAVARALLIIALQRRIRVLCAREFQASITDSVHKLLAEQIGALGLEGYYTVQKTAIKSKTGSEFIFKGLRQNPIEIKSTEGIDICWVEEAQSVSADSWDILIPTVRKEGSEIWITFNPGLPDDETWKRFVINPPDDAVVHKVLFSDNPWFPEVLNKERLYCRRVDDDAYRHIWLGEPKTISDAQVFRNKYTVETFENPSSAVFYHGVDWGFANDPTALIRCYIYNGDLYVDREAYGVGVELDELPALFDSIQTARRWAIKADNSRPETISYMRRQGFNITGAEKWSGSIEDGIELMRSFNQIIVHPRCKHTLDELRLYSYKTDKSTGEILPIIIDANNHCIDAIRYALVDHIRNKGIIKVPRKAVKLQGARKKLRFTI